MLVIINRLGFGARPRKFEKIAVTSEKGVGMKRADFEKIRSMLTLGSFAFACITILGCVVWACAKDTHRDIDAYAASGRPEVDRQDLH